MSDFGDYEPEDAWDHDDAPLDQLRNLFGRLHLLDGLGEPRTIDPPTLLAVIDSRIHDIIRTRSLVGREQLRLQQIVEDLDYVRTRA